MTLQKEVTYRVALDGDILSTTNALLESQNFFYGVYPNDLIQVKRIFFQIEKRPEEVFLIISFHFFLINSLHVF